MAKIADIIQLFEHINVTEKRTRVGRGRASGLGKTCGRGYKGQKSRSGVSNIRAFEGGQTPLYVRLPRRGFNNIFATKYVPVNFLQLQHYIDSGLFQSTITFDDLAKVGLVKRGQIIKILAKGSCPKGLKIEAHAFSASALSAITSSSGEGIVIAGPSVSEEISDAK
jgi:large subunit ribosomal protein L15